MDIKHCIEKMTLEEKAALLTGPSSFSLPGVPRLDIPAKPMADGPHGIRMKPDRSDDCVYTPCMALLGATWDTETAYKNGEVLGTDCNDHGIYMLLAPGINIKRVPQCGRNFEYVGEDPVLAGKIGAGYINGLQSKNVACSLKHFAVNNQETGRIFISADVDERTLRELYLRGYEIAVKESHPKSVMCSYNKINGIWASENKMLLQTILKDEWKFDGFVVSDWGAVHDSAAAIKAGLDLRMPEWDIKDEIYQAVASGELSEERIDEAVERILKVIEWAQPQEPAYDREQRHRIAGEVAANGIVLLKNEHEVLPLRADKLKKIAVVGELAETPALSGGGSAAVFPGLHHVDSALEELRQRLEGVEVKFVPIFTDQHDENGRVIPIDMEEYKKSIADCDAVIVFAGSMQPTDDEDGNRRYTSKDTEEWDRFDCNLPQVYKDFTNAASEQNENVVMVLQNGSALLINDMKESPLAGIVEMWYGGEAAGSAIADVLCGIKNPCGKLSETFPKELRTDLEFPGDKLNIVYSEGMDVGYRYYDKHPEKICYPFGYGLSYTKFQYDHLKVRQKEDSVLVSFNLTNVGSCFGEEVVQLYVGNPSSIVRRPIKELKAFTKVALEPGETKSVSFTVSKRELAYYNVMLHDWATEEGVYVFSVAASSQDIRLQQELVYHTKNPYTICEEQSNAFPQLAE